MVDFYWERRVQMSVINFQSAPPFNGTRENAKSRQIPRIPKG